MSRLYVAEGIFSLTGSNADHCLRVRTTDIPQLTFGLAWELVNQGMILREDVKAEAKKQAEGLDGKSRKFIEPSLMTSWLVAHPLAMSQTELCRWTTSASCCPHHRGGHQ